MTLATDTKTVEGLVSLGDQYLGRTAPFEADRPWWSEIADTTARLETLLGVPALVLRLVHADRTDVGYGGRVVYHVQVTSQPRSDALDRTPMAEWPEIARSHPLRAPWADADGPHHLIEWATEQVGVRRPVQVKTWNLSCLIRLEDVWAKATRSFQSIDAEVIDQVRRHDPGLAPRVVAVDTVNRWSLLEHAPGVDCWEPDPETAHDVVSRWVAVQAALAQRVVNVPELLPHDLYGELDKLLAGDAGRQLTADERAQAEQLLHGLPDIVADLESAGLPITLVHGDFHPGNWRSDGTRRLIVDWADSYRGHPATDLDRLLGWLPADQHPSLIETWAVAWREQYPNSQPHLSLLPMRVLARLIGAVTYQRFLDNIEPDERVYHEGDPAAQIRAALTAYAQLRGE
ncbi:aminoglycoside phosphotransferase family protein [Kribbella sp. CA-294648]|uniref:aminoglycoside phosphotransferase family protein n=1 Tax=Kribbella sp. CA-294648 TaxID=3239948 RepID=UPI003D91DC64